MLIGGMFRVCRTSWPCLRARIDPHCTAAACERTERQSHFWREEEGKEWKFDRRPFFARVSPAEERKEGAPTKTLPALTATVLLLVVCKARHSLSGPYLNDVRTMIGIYPSPLSIFHATYQYCSATQNRGIFNPIPLSIRTSF